GRVSHLVVMNGSHEGALRHQPGQLGQVLADLDAGYRGGDGLKLAAYLLRQIGFHVPHVEVAGPAIEEHENAGIRPGSSVNPRGPLAGRQHLRQCQIQSTNGPDLEHVSPGDPYRALTVLRCSHRSRPHESELLTPARAWP